MVADEIDRLTAEAFVELLRRMREGADPRDAIQAVVAGLDAGYTEVLAAAFSEMLGRFVGSDEIKSYPVGDVALSQRLYAHATATSGIVREIVRQHAAGYQDARRLALEIYEGYGFKDGIDPLQWPARSPKWPKYMRQAITEDPQSFAQYRAIARRMAGNIKTPALKAAYLEALDEMENGRGWNRLGRKLQVAFEERMRYHANRIAQTELHRAWIDQQAEEIMSDDSIEVVQVKMSASHPEVDICDLFAEQDAYGLGPGLYPKARAPKPPFHPHCRCGWISKRLISARGATFRPEAHRTFLRQVRATGGTAAAARIVGSRAKLAVALTQPLEQVYNIHRPPPYRLGRMGGVSTRGVEQVSSAFDVALRGGRHHGVYTRFKDARIHEIEKYIRSYQKRIEEHADKIANPMKYVESVSDRHRNDLVYRYWPREIEDFRQKIAIMQGVIKERQK